MVNPGAFRGMRKEFLMAEKETYAAGMEGGYAADALAQIQRRYFKRFPVELGHFEDPSPEHTASVNDDEPDPEPEEPNPENMTSDEYEEAKKKADHISGVIRYRKAQIKRWLAYQYMKDQDLDPKESGASNPFHSLIFTITGKEAGRPRRRTAVNVWRKTQREVIEAKVKQVSASDSISKGQLAALRDKIARDMFNNLSLSEQEHWKNQATIESDFALEEWKRLMAGSRTTTPKDQQMAIQGLVRISKPFLDFVCKATGWKATIIAGGPEPAQDGRLNVIRQVIHSGCTPGTMKLNWGKALRVRFKQDVISCFGDFLKMCYSPEECRSRALQLDDGFQGLVEEECIDEGVDLDQIDMTSVPAQHASSSINVVSKSTLSTKPAQGALSHPRPPQPSLNPLGPSQVINIPRPVNTSATLPKPFPLVHGRKGPAHQRIPPIRKDPSSINLNRKSSSQPVTALSHPSVSSPSQRSFGQPPQNGLASTNGSVALTSIRGPSSPQSRGRSSVLSFGPVSPQPHAVAPLSSLGATPIPSRCTTPFPSLGALFSSRGPTPFSFRDLSPLPAQPVANHLSHSSPTDSFLRLGDVPASADLGDVPASADLGDVPASADSGNEKQRRKRGRSKGNDEALGRNAQDAVPAKRVRTRSSTAPKKIAVVPSASPPRTKTARKNKPQSKRSSLPKRSPRSQGTEPEPIPEPRRPKKRRKSTGTWIVSDDEGGWVDQDGNHCDPPPEFQRY